MPKWHWIIEKCIEISQGQVKLVAMTLEWCKEINISVAGDAGGSYEQCPPMEILEIHFIKLTHLYCELFYYCKYSLGFEHKIEKSV